MIFPDDVNSFRHLFSRPLAIRNRYRSGPPAVTVRDSRHVHHHRNSQRARGRENIDLNSNTRSPDLQSLYTHLPDNPAEDQGSSPPDRSWMNLSFCDQCDPCDLDHLQTGSADDVPSSSPGVRNSRVGNTAPAPAPAPASTPAPTPAHQPTSTPTSDDPIVSAVALTLDLCRPFLARQRAIRGLRGPVPRPPTLASTEQPDHPFSRLTCPICERIRAREINLERQIGARSARSLCTGQRVRRYGGRARRAPAVVQRERGSFGPYDVEMDYDGEDDNDAFTPLW